MVTNLIPGYSNWDGHLNNVPYPYTFVEGNPPNVLRMVAASGWRNDNGTMTWTGREVWYFAWPVAVGQRVLMRGWMKTGWGPIMTGGGGAGIGMDLKSGSVFLPDPQDRQADKRYVPWNTPAWTQTVGQQIVDFIVPEGTPADAAIDVWLETVPSKWDQDTNPATRDCCELLGDAWFGNLELYILNDGDVVPSPLPSPEVTPPTKVDFSFSKAYTTGKVSLTLTKS